MSLYAIGDLHLSLGTEKPMDVFGGRWLNYVEKITEGFMALHDDDLTVICGDITWGMTMDEALPDFLFIDKLPGKKIILKGNHDYWWTTASKMNAFFQANGFTHLHILHNNCAQYGEYALCGTRGWFFEENGAPQWEKVFRRELIRLEASLKAAGEREKLCFLHYPPLYRGYRCQEIIDLLEQYHVSVCCYGHLHGASHRLAIEGRQGTVDYRLVSADFVGFRPKKILD